MCVEVSFANKLPDGTIESIGGFNGGWGGSSSQWKLPVSKVISLIDTGRWSFFVRVPALITTVKNSSRDVNGDQIVSLDVQHDDT